MKKLLRSLIIGLAFLFISKMNFAQPILGSAGNFVVFSSTGALLNVGNSHLTGNVGAINGAVAVGINIDGVMHVDDGAATTASVDLLSAYTNLTLRTPTAPPLSSVIGNSTTLPAGVYKINSAGFLNGDLTLDANGDPDALFIFHILGAFNTSANSRVILINGAVACNVYWVTEGAIDVGVGTILKGNVIADNAALNIGSDVNLEGRFFSTTGAISFTRLTAYMPLGCSVPVLNGPAAPIIGSTVCYALFSQSGLVTNSGAGTTNVMGDVGTNFGVTAGFVPANVNGTIRSVPDASTQTAGDDLLVFDNYFNNLVTDIELLYPAAFGNGLVLTPHTYIMNGAATLIETVTLNAQDNPNAIFVIKINGPFSTIASAKVLLINGAQAKNVFWKVTGAVDISTLSEFKGTVVSNAAVNFGAGSFLEGRALTTNGAITTNSVTAEVTAGCSTLPVTWLYFNGKDIQGSIKLEWATASETNNNFFAIERSADGTKFEILSTIFAKGTATTENKYSFTDMQPYNVNYYRVSQTDFNGKKEYFRTIMVSTSFAKGFEVTHYIEENNISVQIAGAQAGFASLELYSITGQKMAAQKIALTKENTIYKIQKPSQKGIYVLYIVSQGKKLYAGKVLL